VNILADSLFPIYVRNGATPEKFKAGYINSRAHTVIDPVFDDAERFVEGLASVRIDGRYGVIDLAGAWIIPPCSMTPFAFSESRSPYTQDRLWGVMAADGKVIVLPKYHAVSRFQEGRAWVRDPSQNYGFIDTHGDEVIPPFFEDARLYRGGLAPAKLQGRWGYIDSKANFEIAAKLQNALIFSEGLGCVLVDDRWGYINRSGDFEIPPRFAFAGRFNEGLADVGVNRGGLRGYIDRSGEYAIAPAFIYTKAFSEGLAATKDPGQSHLHFIDSSGAPAFKGEFLSAESFTDGLCLVSTFDTIGYLNRAGETVWEGAYVAKI
jgi:WG containing repeat